jgi:hypothetical protein
MNNLPEILALISWLLNGGLTVWAGYVTKQSSKYYVVAAIMQTCLAYLSSLHVAAAVLYLTAVIAGAKPWIRQTRTAQRLDAYLYGDDR